ncbi:MAG TPA: RICIN domain-containing protein [Desulfuromonadaceae bacterium]|nr:RICIN domain-containing protein [Desulfuromonadaceae bacterium]
MKIVKCLITVLLALACASTALASLPTKVFMPYVDTSLWPTFSLTNCNKITGQKYFMLAFVLSGSGNQPMWNGVTPMSDHFMLTDIQGLRAKGGDVAVSFGGAAGTPIDSTITDVNALVSAYSQVIDTYSLTWIDFDIEGFWIADSASVSRRNQAAAKLQAKYPGLRISYTLPVLQSGLTQDGINVVNGAKAAGVKIYCVNVMAMDYGGAVSDMAGAATSAASATRSQTGLNIGITPMIGQNDAQGEIFTLANARTVLSFANGASYVNTLAFWSAGRDNGGCPGQTSASATCSGVSQTNFQFIATWKSYSGSGTATPDFSLSASPASVTMTQGSSGTSTITENDLNGYTGTVTLSASGLPSGVTASFNPTSTTGSSTLTLTASSTAATGTATITITGTDGTLTHTTSITLTVNSSGGGGALPPGWTDVDVGAVGLAGNASYNAGTFTINGSGSDIWTTADQFNYAYQSVSGDQTVIARVISESQTAGYAKAGVMIRESLAADSINASVLITPTNGVALEVRTATGVATINVVGWVRGVQPPKWVKLVRSGSTFTGSYSADGSTWTQFASTNVTMAASTFAGLAVTAHNNAALNNATFDNVSISAPGGATLDTTKKYKLQNVASGLVLNNQGSLTNGSKITQWTATTSSTNLQWRFIATSNGYYQINSVKSGLDAVVQSASTAAGAGIIQWAFGAAGNDQWQPVQNSDGSYTFVNLHSGLVLADPGASTSTSTQMDQETSNGGSNQKWQLLPQ